MQKIVEDVNEWMNKNINKHDLINKPVNNGNTIDSKNIISKNSMIILVALVKYLWKIYKEYEWANYNT